MKRTLTTTALLLTFFLASAQGTTSPFTRIYGFATGAFPFAGGVSGELGARAVLNDKWCFSAGHIGGEIEAKTPPGYMSRTFYTWLGTYTESKPIQSSNFTYLALGKYFGKGSSTGLFVETAAGISSGTYYDFEAGYSSSSTNYRSFELQEKSFGVMLRAGADFPLASWVGLGLGVYYNYNGGELADNVGIDLRVMLGKTGKRVER